MNRIQIYNFGPIKYASVNLEKRMQTYIGAQASGKSTICRVVYFCQKIRDYTLDFLMDSEQFISNHRNEYFNNYLKYLTRQFMGCFGKTTHMQKFKIAYCFGDKQITITLNQDGFIRFVFDEQLKNCIYALTGDASQVFLGGMNNSIEGSVIDQLSALVMLKQQFRSRLCVLFDNESEIIYIPAGRSLLATMSEQLHDLSISDMDLTMQDFINLIRNTKSRFGSKIPEIVKNYTKTVKGQINNESLALAYEMIKQILKADYASESDGEKIYFDERHWVKLMYGSSGQQEVLWILMLIFVIILERRKNFVIIEEPEAHLFPAAQKRVVELIALMINTTDSKVIITTHSPYILTSLNILLYSDKVENGRRGKGQAVVPRNLRISYDVFDAFKVERTSGKENTESLMDKESHMISTDYIDEVSAVTNKELERLMDKEFEWGD